MRYLIVLTLALLSITACQKDADDVLNHDGPNATGPLLETGYYELAAQFTSNETARYEGRDLERVSFYMGPAPAKLELIIYDEGITDTVPGDELYRIDLTNRLEPFSWNEHRLNTPIALGDKDIWLAIGLTHNEEQQSLGCDSGPREQGGDWYYNEQDDQWYTYVDWTGVESVNWNIRGYVSGE